MLKLLLPFLALTTTQSLAGDRDDLIHALETAGRHSYEDERREVKVNGCQMTTYRWRDRPDHGWVLWTSFQFDMADAQLNEDSRFPGKKYVYAKLKDEPEEIGMVIFGFTMREGTQTRQERSILRDPSSETQPSPRGDGASHYYEWRGDMLISMKGTDVKERAITFTNSYDRYVEEYCTFSS
ncbi:MAG: hypothetical protein ABJ246_03160 [Paracoccaceae bacterium]